MTRHKYLLITLFVFCCFQVRAQAPSHEQILSTLKDPHTPAEAIDALLPRLQVIEKSDIFSPDSQQVALSIFQEASYGYARNYHFKQGLLVYQGYLAMKDRFAYLDKTKAIHALIAHNEQQQNNLNTEIDNKKSTASQLALDIEYAGKANGKFSRNYSLVVILVTAVLALIFIRINMNTSKAKNILKENRRKMLEMQRIAMLGRFYDGDKEFMKTASRQLSQLPSELSKRIQEKYNQEKNDFTTLPVQLKQLEILQQNMADLMDK